ncbi:hypothetical protein BAE44_0021525 [Dichanthelium oligosanthes]|uniref:Uncharacterized protein n=1 Tax=Dichanthelium oligosanthes TaxID=888268 RepID=A0A1E5UXC6_9POAL|nr:hypothetical protein BAE44_0021525 [Dichanthelium oligosanthes]
MFERRLTCFGCGIGFLCPIIWYVAALLYCCKYYNRDPRERPGLAASAVLVSFRTTLYFPLVWCVQATIFTAALIVTLSVLLICCVNKRFLNSCAS